jgi:hypothetical protein
MDNIGSEVLIYLQQVKNYFKTNTEAREYFIGDSDEDTFFKHLTDIAEKNFETEGNPMLNKEQFELLRTTIKVVQIAEKTYTKNEIEETRIFIDTSFGQICLN